MTSKSKHRVLKRRARNSERRMNHREAKNKAHAMRGRGCK